MVRFLHLPPNMGVWGNWSDPTDLKSVALSMSVRIRPLLPNRNGKTFLRDFGAMSAVPVLVAGVQDIHGAPNNGS